MTRLLLAPIVSAIRGQPHIYSGFASFTRASSALLNSQPKTSSMSEALNVVITEITKDTPNFDAQLEEMTTLLSLAFTKPLDPMTSPAVGVTYEDNPELHHHYSRAQLQVALTGAGRVFRAYINTNGVERLAGVAVWYEPGRQFLDRDEQRIYWENFTNRLDNETGKWWEEVVC
ncbi:unnamed protein product [Rhizoctonia solani]|uniref:Uncharacterized protein n=1 Tax=Rhizoctonia solani TaxID=456999 RepID=A0A8H3HWD6_9AGAM|nr:unnamed protein product [Rhizoctonia solani]